MTNESTSPDPSALDGKRLLALLARVEDCGVRGDANGWCGHAYHVPEFSREEWPLLRALRLALPALLAARDETVLLRSLLLEATTILRDYSFSFTTRVDHFLARAGEEPYRDIPSLDEVRAVFAAHYDAASVPVSPTTGP